jgi:CMP-N-acetylneuraminic acid synthetase
MKRVEWTYKDISYFIPCRADSQRIKNKNTKSFAGIDGGLINLKIDQLLSVDNGIPIVISTDDKKVINIAESYNNKRIKVHRRPQELCLSSTKVVDLIKYVPSIINTKHVFWLHVTTPLVTSDIYCNALNAYFECLERGYDSIMSVTKYQAFLWDKQKKDIINYDRKLIKYPQTQDLDPLYEINHAFYAMPVENYHRYEDRIGINPFLFELSKIQSIDLDWEEDFIIAEQIFKYYSASS